MSQIVIALNIILKHKLSCLYCHEMLVMRLHSITNLVMGFVLNISHWIFTKGNNVLYSAIGNTGRRFTHIYETYQIKQSLLVSGYASWNNKHYVVFSIDSQIV